MLSPRQTALHSSKVHFLRQLAGSLVSVVFPSACALCGDGLDRQLLGVLCHSCWHDLAPWNGSLCHRCGLPFAGDVVETAFLCADCRLDEPRFDCARSFGVYTGKLRAAVIELKFHRREQLGTLLGGLLIEPWRALESANLLRPPVLVVPVPLHRSRERERGYNQARGLASGFLRKVRREAGNANNFKLAAHCLTRKRSTAPQSGLSLHARGENVRGVFAVDQPGRVRGRNVLLVDDVMTTGATVSACASALKRAGADRVGVLTLARATPQFPDLTPFPAPDSASEFHDNSVKSA